MTLVEVCEPLFQHLCQLNYSCRKGAKYDFMQARKDIEDLLSEIKTKTQSDAGLVGLYDDRMELALIFFVDNFISTSSLPFNHEWSDNRIAYERSPAVMTGDADFFHYFDAVLADKSEGATQKLAVYYTCVGLGMTGEYSDRPEVLRRKMLEASRRLNNVMDTKVSARICPDADEHINTDNLIPPPVKSPVVMTIALVGLVVTFFIAFGVLYQNTVKQLNADYQTILKHSNEIISNPTQ